MPLKRKTVKSMLKQYNYERVPQRGGSHFKYVNKAVLEVLNEYDEEQLPMTKKELIDTYGIIIVRPHKKEYPTRTAHRLINKIVDNLCDTLGCCPEYVSVQKLCNKYNIRKL